MFQDNVDYLLTAVDYLERVTTIPTGSTSEAIADGSAQPLVDDFKGEDIV